ncbi:MAG: hypothetical protein K5872_12115 [Rhizobiaceae bacterium]|nr:hypothetical protein [Rhizobiaceae bacterium]MCV0406961.1 hypothetical protein [Rhizobiaceae bacterium]
MSDRGDIAPNGRGWRRLSYTCRCGWVDWGHALPGGPLGLKRQLDSERGDWPGLSRVDITYNGRPAYIVVYGQAMGNRLITVSLQRHWVVLKGLSDKQKEQVGLGIFLAASHQFESLQSSFPFSLRGSGYSMEDLVSNLIGFYSAFRDVSQDDMRRMCGEVSVEESYRIWDRYLPNGLGAIRNKTTRPVLFPSDQCPAGATGFPDELEQLSAASAGVWYVVPTRRYIDGMLINAGIPLEIDSSGNVRPRRR